MMIVNKSRLATILGVSKSRVSQYVRAGLPVRGDGLIDVAAAQGWVAANVDPVRAPPRLAGGYVAAPAPSDGLPPPLPFRWVIRAALRAAYAACGEHGVQVEAARRIATLAALIIWQAVEENHGLEDALTMDEADFVLPPFGAESAAGVPPA